jgi:hypothetical protein
MRILRLAVRNQRWDLAAHTIVLATARELEKEGKVNGEKREKKKRGPTR